MSMKIEKLKSNKGAVTVVEAAIVFPIAIFVLFFLIYLGNAYYIKANVDTLASRYAILAAAECADPHLSGIIETGSVSTNINESRKPYRYLLPGYGSDIANKYKTKLENELNSITGFLPGTKPENCKCEFNYKNGFVFQTIDVQINYNIQFPIKFVFMKENTVAKMVSSDSVLVSDPPELILNTNMVIDYYKRSDLKDKIDGVLDKIKSFIS